MQQKRIKCSQGSIRFRVQSLGATSLVLPSALGNLGITQGRRA